MNELARRHVAHAIMLGGPFVVLAIMAGMLHLTHPDRRKRAVPTAWRRTLSGTWAVAAALHVSVIQEHLAQSLMLAVFFVLISAVQAVYSVFVWRRVSPRLLLLGLGTSSVVVALWSWTRIVSVPFGFGPREPVGVVDALCTAVEVLACMVSIRLLILARPALPSSPGYLGVGDLEAAQVAVGVQFGSDGECGGRHQIRMSKNRGDLAGAPRSFHPAGGLPE
jgi:hypothetical protein